MRLYCILILWQFNIVYVILNYPPKFHILILLDMIPYQWTASAFIFFCIRFIHSHDISVTTVFHWLVIDYLYTQKVRQHKCTRKWRNILELKYEKAANDNWVFPLKSCLQIIIAYLAYGTTNHDLLVVLFKTWTDRFH